MTAAEGPAPAGPSGYQGASAEMESAVSDPSDPGRTLTPRQRQVLEQAALGLSNRQIGEALGIAEQTVKNHLASAMRKMSLHDRTHAVVIAIGQGWISLPVDDGNRAPVSVPATTDSRAEA